MDKEQLKEFPDDIFWVKVLSKQNAIGELMFPHLKSLICGIITLPHSSAAAERIFSQLSLIKTNTRNRLYIRTCDALISSKELFKGSKCFEWNPATSPGLFSRKWKIQMCNKINNDISDTVTLYYDTENVND